jgi:hypothetical protein
VIAGVDQVAIFVLFSLFSGVFVGWVFCGWVVVVGGFRLSAGG